MHKKTVCGRLIVTPAAEALITSCIYVLLSVLRRLVQLAKFFFVLWCKAINNGYFACHNFLTDFSREIFINCSNCACPQKNVKKYCRLALHAHIRISCRISYIGVSYNVPPMVLWPSYFIKTGLRYWAGTEKEFEKLPMYLAA